MTVFDARLSRRSLRDEVDVHCATKEMFTAQLSRWFARMAPLKPCGPLSWQCLQQRMGCALTPVPHLKREGESERESECV
eukprot:6187167-Pleurochrysis_carterae.AAC.1